MGRISEVSLTIIFIILSAPAQICVAATLFWQLGRPVMFRQIRAGINGKNITINKFRTMTNSYNSAGALQPDNQRQTRTTRFIRKLRLDELPQLWSVLRGQMALVGPRPLLSSTLAGFRELGELRNSVRPGLTGWAQVNGNTRLDNSEKLVLDLWYVAHRSAALDMRILAKTILVPLRGEVRDNARLQEAKEWAHHRFGDVIVAVK
ncbi:MAG: sugar transferase [Paracoccus sp. (in: a-proteobacteria)]